MKPTESPDYDDQATWWVSFLFQTNGAKMKIAPNIKFFDTKSFKNGTILFTSEE